MIASPSRGKDCSVLEGVEDDSVAAAISIIGSSVVIGATGVARIVRVLRISTSVSRQRLQKSHPQSRMALLLVTLHPNDRGQMRLRRGMQSDFSSSADKPILVQYNTNACFSLNHPIL